MSAICRIRITLCHVRRNLGIEFRGTRKTHRILEWNKASITNIIARVSSIKCIVNGVLGEGKVIGSVDGSLKS